MKPAVQRMLDLVYPPRCPFCGQVLGPLTECPDCAAQLHRLVLRPPHLPETEFHIDNLGRAAALYQYKGLARGGVLRFKKGGHPDAARWFGAQMATLFGCDFAAAYGTMQAERLPLAPADLIVPAPSSHRRTWQPARLLAIRLSRATGVPWQDVLKKMPGREPQEGLNGKDRLRNARGAVGVVRQQPVAGRRILLVDDVITTGGTANECARVLLRAGAQSVDLVCIAASFPGRDDM